ncbi:hypothetical protein HU200_025641 [Digitaria exilis]|uniref:KIB1-4 beta-propeller domain-containing protein n=1 Tax=Digitaria exilis TaxID=1010633 RepID=A0A835BZL0_9POAL|nr:hypothetical protein HU200_025641 [Digitaria exilis]CAB3496873.1 unnamed protein product [Digitaria exilis]
MRRCHSQSPQEPEHPTPPPPRPTHTAAAGGMGKRAGSGVPIPSSSRPLKRPRATRAASRTQIPSCCLPSKRPRALDGAPPGLLSCSGHAEIPASRPSKRLRTVRAASRAQISSSSPPLKQQRALDDAPPCSRSRSGRGKIPSFRLPKQKKAPRGGACSTAHINFPSWEAKGAPCARGGACSTEHINVPSWGAKRARTGTAHINLPWWGAKRARTGTARRRPYWYAHFSFVSASGESQPDLYPRRRSSRDWADLGDGPAGLVAELVLADDLSGYIRFRAVCRAWRRCSSDPHAFGALDRRFHPRGWIKVCEKHPIHHPQRRRFLNLRSGQCVEIDVPELLDHRLLRCTTEGLLVLLHAATNLIRVLNPLTRQVTELPPIAADLASGFRPYSHDSAGLADEHTVLLYFGRAKTLAFAKPGDEQWVLVKTDELLIMATMSYAGRFYGVTTKAVVAVDMRGGGSLPPRLVVVARLAKSFSAMADTVHLVDNGEGDGLVLVHNKVYQFSDGEEDWWLERKYEAYRVDLDAGKMIHVRHLGGQAVFIGSYCALSVSPRTFPCISADTVYPGAGLLGTTGAYSIKDGSFEPSSYDTQNIWANPLTITDLLSTYVSQYKWLY